VLGPFLTTHGTMTSWWMGVRDHFSPPMVGCNIGSGGGNFSKVKLLVANWIGNGNGYSSVF